MSRPRLTVGEAVTPEHGEIFAKEWHDHSIDTGAMTEAFGRTGVVMWPDTLRAQMRFHDVEEEITERIFEELRPVIVQMFVRVAGEVLAQERNR